MRQLLTKELLRILEEYEPNTTRRGTRVTLADRLCQDFDVFIKNHPQIENSVKEGFKKQIREGDLIGTIELMEPWCGTFQLIRLIKEFKASIQEYRSPNRGKEES